jgi:hypothetical protein
MLLKGLVEVFDQPCEMIAWKIANVFRDSLVVRKPPTFAAPKLILKCSGQQRTYPHRVIKNLSNDLPYRSRISDKLRLNEDETTSVRDQYIINAESIDLDLPPERVDAFRILDEV